MLAALSMYAIESMKSTSILFVPVLLSSERRSPNRGEDRISVLFLSILPNLVIIVVMSTRDIDEHVITAIAVHFMSCED